MKFTKLLFLSFCLFVFFGCNPAKKMYDEAQSLIESQYFDKAIALLEDIVKKYPNSDEAKKSKYLMIQTIVGQAKYFYGEGDILNAGRFYSLASDKILSLSEDERTSFMYWHLHVSSIVYNLMKRVSPSDPKFLSRINELYDHRLSRSDDSFTESPLRTYLAGLVCEKRKDFQQYKLCIKPLSDKIKIDRISINNIKPQFSNIKKNCDEYKNIITKFCKDNLSSDELKSLKNWEKIEGQIKKEAERELYIKNKDERKKFVQHITNLLFNMAKECEATKRKMKNVFSQTFDDPSKVWEGTTNDMRAVQAFTYVVRYRMNVSPGFESIQSVVEKNHSKYGLLNKECESELRKTIEKVKDNCFFNGKYVNYSWIKKNKYSVCD